MTTETEKDDLTTRRKKFQEADKVPGENEASKIKDTLEGTAFSMTGSEKTGYEWGCPACRASNTHSANISKRKEVLSFLCSGCNRVFDIIAAGEVEEAPEFTGDQINKHTWGIEVDSDGDLEFRLGNWTDAGWFWSGGPEMVFGFLARMRSELKGLLAEVSQHPVILAKLDQAFEVAKANPDAIAHLGYTLSGDNQKWHFGGVEDDLSRGLERDLEAFPQDGGPLPDYRAQIEEEVPYTWARSLSDEQWGEVFSNAAGYLNWTPTDAQRDKFCTDLVENLVRGNYLSMEDFSSFVQSLSELTPDTIDEYTYEDLDNLGDSIFEAQLPKFLDYVRGELDQLRESVPESEAHPRRVDPNHPKLPFEGSKAKKGQRVTAEQVPTRIVNINGKPTKLSLVPGDLRRKDVKAQDVATCGACGRSWDDEQSTSWTPAPSARCPFEYYHRGASKRHASLDPRTVRRLQKEALSYFQSMKIVPDSDDIVEYVTTEISGESGEDWDTVAAAVESILGIDRDASGKKGEASKVGSKRKKALEEEKAQIGTGYKDEPMPLVDQIIAYEQGEMSEEEMISFFQGLIDSGLAWQLQGHYGRTAKALIDAGLCTPPKRGASQRKAVGGPTFTQENHWCPKCSSLNFYNANPEGELEDSLWGCANCGYEGSRDEFEEGRGKPTRFCPKCGKPGNGPYGMCWKHGNEINASQRRAEEPEEEEEEMVTLQCPLCGDTDQESLARFENEGPGDRRRCTNEGCNDAVMEHIGSQKPSKQFKKVKVGRRATSPLQTVSREAYSSFIRTLDGVQEVSTEEPVGQRIKILKGSIPVAEAFYPTQGDPVYQIAPPESEEI